MSTKLQPPNVFPHLSVHNSGSRCSLQPVEDSCSSLQKGKGNYSVLPSHALTYLQPVAPLLLHNWAASHFLDHVVSALMNSLLKSLSIFHHALKTPLNFWAKCFHCEKRCIMSNFLEQPKTLLIHSTCTTFKFKNSTLLYLFLKFN